MVLAIGGGTPYLGNVTTKQVKGKLESLQGFKDRVDAIIKELNGSKASQGHVRQQEVNRTAFGGEFGEAQDLYTEYNRVHAQLTTLSGVLGDQIEAMWIAMHAVEHGFSSMEEETQRRFWQIQDQAKLQEEQQPGKSRADDDQMTY